MGKFDGYLICSDLDGTFWNGENPANAEAVRYFTENGGRFSFMTGRQASFLRELPFFDCMNAPAGLYNGSVAYDFTQKQVLFEERVPLTAQTFLDVIGDWRKKTVRISSFDDISGELINLAAPETLSRKELQAHMLKIVPVFEDVETADAFIRYAQQQDVFQDCYISKSWSVGVEFNSRKGTKGHALDFIKRYLGNIHTAIGIGDYWNDIPLVQHADIGVAVGSAIEPLKQAADWIVNPCQENAVEDLIRRLEQHILNQKHLERGTKT